MAGLLLFYHALSQILNKSWIDVEDGMLKISSRPIPVWQGNVEVPVKSVEQIFVEEKVTRHQDGISRSYIIKALLQNGERMKLFGNNEIDKEQALMIERVLENYLDITPIYISGSVFSEKPIPHHGRRKLNTKYPEISFLGPEDVLIYEEERFDVLNRMQLDWSNRLSGIQLQGVNRRNENISVYLDQSLTDQYVFIETELNLLATNPFNFRSEDPPKAIAHQGINYDLYLSMDGKGYQEDHRVANNTIDGKPVRQWIYQNRSNSQIIRITEIGWKKTYWLGNPVSPDHITVDSMNLDLKEMIRERRPSNNDEFV